MRCDHIRNRQRVVKGRVVKVENLSLLCVLALVKMETGWLPLFPPLITAQQAENKLRMGQVHTSLYVFRKKFSKSNSSSEKGESIDFK